MKVFGLQGVRSASALVEKSNLTGFDKIPRGDN